MSHGLLVQYLEISKDDLMFVQGPTAAWSMKPRDKDPLSPGDCSVISLIQVCTLHSTNDVHTVGTSVDVAQ